MNVRKKSLQFETATISRDELALFLLNTANKVKLVNRKMKDFSSHSHFSVIYNKEELTELLNITIAKTINAHEAYVLKQLGKPIPEFYPNISDDLDLSTFGNIVGYLRSAYDNNISKDYKKHIATKRSASVVSYDSAQQEDSNENKQGNAVFNLIYENSIEITEDKAEYSRLIKEIHSFLKSYDKKINSTLLRKHGEIREDKKSKLSYLFIYLLDPKYKGKFIHIKEKLPNWTQYLFKKNKEELSSIIKRNFPNNLDFLYNFLNESYDSYGETLMSKPTENYNDQSCDVSSCFNCIFKNDNIQLELTIQLFRLNNGKKEVLDSETKKMFVDKDSIDFGKTTLHEEMNETLLRFKKTAEERRLNSLKEIYSYKKRA